MTAQAHIFTGTEISTGRRRPSEIVAEYDAKRADLPDALKALDTALKPEEMALPIILKRPMKLLLNEIIK